MFLVTVVFIWSCMLRHARRSAKQNHVFCVRAFSQQAVISSDHDAADFALLDQGGAHHGPGMCSVFCHVLKHVLLVSWRDVHTRVAGCVSSILCDVGSAVAGGRRIRHV